MVRTFGSALTALGLVTTLSACAQFGGKAAHSASALGSKIDPAAVGSATRAQAALEAGDYATAVQFAERAVAATPADAGLRALLGNAYFGAGRFASAESAYRDSLSLNGEQPQLVLKLALVTIAQGRNDAALRDLEAARGMLDPSDYGLALALAGQPAMAVAVLEPAARQVGADGRIRQNLALAYALSGEWTAARTIASQDVPADQLDTRIQQWMVFAKPARASDQVAALTGIAPAATDPGQPVQLALNARPGDARMADAAPAAVPAAPLETAAASSVEQVTAFAAAEPAAVPPPYIPPSAEMPAEPAPPAKAKRAPVVKAAAAVAAPRAARGNSKAVVQLGAYTSKANVGGAWSRLAKKYPALRGYTPTTARFESGQGVVYRLAAKGFASDAQAREFCSALKSSGATCFVRNGAGDAPIRLAAL